MSEDLTTTYVEQGEFDRDMTYLPDRITRDARTPERGPQGPTWPVEPDRYRLVAAKACPWANRAIIVRRLLGLEDVISLGMPGPTHDSRSWTFDLDPDGRDEAVAIRLDRPGRPVGSTIGPAGVPRDPVGEVGHVPLELLTLLDVRRRLVVAHAV